MSFNDMIESIPPAFYGVIIGSLLTIIGVVLTNISNTKRLRLQHEHERAVKEKERDLNLRRDVHMDAMEAISAGLTAVSRFSELNESPDSLMESYSDLSPKIGKVTIVGNNETIEAVANFNLALTGAFLRLSAKREEVNRLLQHSQLLENRIKETQKEINELSRHLPGEDNPQIIVELEANERQLTELESEDQKVGFQLLNLMEALVKESVQEVAALDQLLVPLISLMRSELELPFDEKYYAEILKKGHQKQNQYLESFFKNQEDSSNKENQT